MDRSKVAAGGLLAAVFVSGLILGGVGWSALKGQGQQQERRTRTPYIETLQDSLGLTEEQRPAIEVALEEFYENWRTTSRELEREAQAEERLRTQEFRVVLRGKIAALLDSMQVVTYQRMIARSDSIRAARAERRRR